MIVQQKYSLQNLPDPIYPSTIELTDYVNSIKKKTRYHAFANIQKNIGYEKFLGSLKKFKEKINLKNLKQTTKKETTTRTPNHDIKQTNNIIFNQNSLKLKKHLKSKTEILSTYKIKNVKLELDRLEEKKNSIDVYQPKAQNEQDLNFQTIQYKFPKKFHKKQKLKHKIRSKIMQTPIMSLKCKNIFDSTQGNNNSIEYQSFNPSIQLMPTFPPKPPTTKKYPKIKKNKESNFKRLSNFSMYQFKEVKSEITQILEGVNMNNKIVNIKNMQTDFQQSKTFYVTSDKGIQKGLSVNEKKILNRIKSYKHMTRKSINSHFNT